MNVIYLWKHLIQANINVKNRTNVDIFCKG